jgi:xanthine dehydrogenase YagT iron-sulfur-binding subunit
VPTAPAELLILRVNGADHALAVEPRRTLLDALRTDLALTGAKQVCEMGNCGACTVLIDGRTMYACLLLAIDCDGREITTIEGLASGSELHPVQQAFIDADAFQCGYCTSGQILSLSCLLNENPHPSEDEIRRAVSGNLCRCGAYQNIVRAGQLAAERMTNGHQ